MNKTTAKQKNKRKLAVPALIALSLLLITVGTTVAFLMTKTTPVVNTFTPSQVSCEVKETFDGVTKSNVNVKNTSDIPAYIRVRLVSYRVNNQNQHIGGEAKLPQDFQPGENWVLDGNFYYYKLPVNAGSTTKSLINSINLATYPVTADDADGGKQVIEVIAEAIQSEPESAVHDAWGVTVNNGILSISN